MNNSMTQTDDEIKKNIESIHKKYGASAGLTQEMFNLFHTLQEEYKKELLEKIEQKCPKIEEIKQDGGYLWVKIPNNNYESYRILPDDIINN